ncbi:MAG: DUF2750 domain-containing protein [Motiliproteus sp.]|nr:DUF2750 domain-containing protein [Motiliproteus sp.]MCW9051777.1 DUF2750 domain-containing protein [Motiliproteus sp.]
MPYRLEEGDIDRLLNLPSIERYSHFLEKVADWEELWGARDDEGWLVQATSDGQTYISLWPHPDFCQDAVRRFFPGNVAEEIDFEFLLEQWLPLLKQEGIKISVFPNRQWHSVLIDADKFEADLRNEIKKYQ